MNILIMILSTGTDIISNIGDLVCGSVVQNLGDAVQKVGGVGVGASVGFSVLKKGLKVAKNALVRDIDANPLQDSFAIDSREESAEMRANGYERDETGNWVKKQYKPYSPSGDDFPF